jgi:hypothetical protein
VLNVSRKVKEALDPAFAAALDSLVAQGLYDPMVPAR